MDAWRRDNLTRFYLNLSKRWYQSAKTYASPYEKVDALDKCLSACENYKHFMHRLGCPVPPAVEASFQKAKASRERYAQAQKVQEDTESLERIKAAFAQF